MSGQRGQVGLYCLGLVCRVVFALWAQARAEGCVSSVFGERTGEGIECFWLDAGTSSPEVQVLEIRSMMTAGIRATLSLIGTGLGGGDDGLWTVSSRGSVDAVGLKG
jgi:hypothetical protein